MIIQRLVTGERGRRNASPTVRANFDSRRASKRISPRTIRRRSRWTSAAYVNIRNCLYLWTQSIWRHGCVHLSLPKYRLERARLDRRCAGARRCDVRARELHGVHTRPSGQSPDWEGRRGRRQLRRRQYVTSRTLPVTCNGHQSRGAERVDRTPPPGGGETPPGKNANRDLATRQPDWSRRVVDLNYHCRPRKNAHASFSRFSLCTWLLHHGRPRGSRSRHGPTILGSTILGATTLGATLLSLSAGGQRPPGRDGPRPALGAPLLGSALLRF
jgi:hypothetical protein